MRFVASVFRGLATFGVMAIAVPWMLLQLAAGLMIATLVAVFVLALFRVLFLDVPDAFGDPTTPLGWIGFVLVFLTCWATMISLWARYTGVALWFARSSDSHGSARFADKRERARLQHGTGLLIGRDLEYPS